MPEASASMVVMLATFSFLLKKMCVCVSVSVHVEAQGQHQVSSEAALHLLR